MRALRAIITDIPMNLSLLSKTIRDARKKLDWTQPQLGNAAHIDSSYISKIENNKLDYPPSRSTIAGLAQALKIDEDQLLLMAGHIPEKLKPLVCRFLLNAENALEIMTEQLPQFVEPSENHD